MILLSVDAWLGRPTFSSSKWLSRRVSLHAYSRNVMSDKLSSGRTHRNILDLVEEPIDSRIMAYLNADPVGDGGQFDMAVNIVEVSIFPGPAGGDAR